MKRPELRILVLAVMLPLESCATNGYSPKSFELIVEGNEASYPAFEAAANACGYTAFWRFPGATVQGQKVPPHYNLSRVGSATARCATRWVADHPETALQISAH